MTTAKGNTPYYCIQIQHLLKLNFNALTVLEEFSTIQIQHLLKLNNPFQPFLLSSFLIQIQHLLKLNPLESLVENSSNNSNTTLVKVKL